MLILVGMAIVETGTRSIVRIASTVSGSTGKWSHVVGLTVFLNLSKYTESTLRWNQTGNNFLRHVFRGSSQQVLELDRTEFLDDGALFADALMEAFLEFVQLALLFVQILDQPPSSFLHLMKSPLESLNNASHRALDLPSVLGVPNVVRDEFLNGFLPLFLQKGLVTHDFQLVHQSVDILNQDVISSNQHFFLLLMSLTFICILSHGS